MSTSSNGVKGVSVLSRQGCRGYEISLEDLHIGFPLESAGQLKTEKYRNIISE